MAHYSDHLTTEVRPQYLDTARDAYASKEVGRAYTEVLLSFLAAWVESAKR